MFSPRFVFIAMLAMALFQPAVAKDSSALKAVLVTGAGSGIGLAITQYLVSHGFYVYAGARKVEDPAAQSVAGYSLQSGYAQGLLPCALRRLL